MSKRFTGFSEFYHNAGLTTIDESGEVLFASQAERFSKMKNDAVIPNDMWDKYVLDTDHLSFYEDHSLRFRTRKLSSGIGSNIKPDWKTLAGGPMQCAPESDDLLDFDQCHQHHISHVANAVFTRPWDSMDDTVMVSIDGVGEVQTQVIYDKDFNIKKEVHWPKSIGLVYSACTEKLGLRILEDEYVVMGLASYGEDKFSHKLFEWYNSIPDIAEGVSEGKLIDQKDGPRQKAFQEMWDILNTHRELMSEEDFAASVQEFARVAILDVMKEARQYGSKLAYSGGVAQNVVTNSFLFDIFDDVHIAIEPTDGGSSLGAAAMSWHQETGKDKLIWTPYMGYDMENDINPREVVDHLLSKEYCGVASGRAEFGPRALGNRSLIADVRKDVKDTVNTIKRRQKYRPFAPAILEEYADEYFEGPMNEYMQFTAKAKHDHKSVIHVDGTSRVQLLRKDCTSVFRKIVEEFYDRTGVPMLLNTSLNIRGRPMVNDLHDAELFESKYDVKVFY
jgi:carbamoyltransferase